MKIQRKESDIVGHTGHISQRRRQPVLGIEHDDINIEERPSRQSRRG